ncbi:MAG: phosphocarrier protein [Desulfobacteraceae bacterium Eth-SRB1]|nr:MAG: phosphocarrier protein [Desulfobacteraceae bacterium Eth-SRB1]
MPLWLNSDKFFILNTKLSKDVIIINELGLHARSAAKIAKLAQNAKSTVWVIRGEEKVDASSILDVLTLACSKGSKITLKVDNKSDMDILNSIVELVEKGFEE